jgi:hypothetical protein
MLHPILSLIIRRPQLVVEHLAAYASLAQEEASQAGTQLALRAVAWGVAILAFVVFLILAGIALMLGVLNETANGVLFAVPGGALLLCVVAAGFALKPLPLEPFKELKAQIEADKQALQAIGADE